MKHTCDECSRAVEILLVEDNPMDVIVTKEALTEGKLRNRLNVVEDGEEAIDFLLRKGKFVNAPTPDVILLDLNLPRKDGREVLAEIKQHPSLLQIPVVVLTTSKEEEDILRSYQLHANCFVTKPLDLDQFMSVIKAIEGFWFTVVKLPER